MAMTMAERDVNANGNFDNNNNTNKTATPRNSSVAIERWLRHGEMVNYQPQNPPGFFYPLRRRGDDRASTSLSDESSFFCSGDTGPDLSQSFQRMSLGGGQMRGLPGRDRTGLGFRSGFGLGFGVDHHETPSPHHEGLSGDIGSPWMGGLGFGYSDSIGSSSVTSRNSSLSLVSENSFYAHKNQIGVGGSYENQCFKGVNGLRASFASSSQDHNLSVTRDRARLTSNHHQSLIQYEGFKCEESFIVDLSPSAKNKRSVGGSEKEVEYRQRKAVLENFRAVAAQRGFVYFMAMDQSGCRTLQKVFEEGTIEDVDVIFKSVIEHVVELSTDPFGNYLVQKLLEVCLEEHRRQIVYAITFRPEELVRISLNAHGTRVVQKMVETATDRWSISLIMSGLKPGILDLIKDLNGNHVLQSCLKCLTNQDNAFIFAAATSYAVEVSTHRHGCCVMQRCIERSSGGYQLDLITEILKHAVLLAADPYGNYVIQFIIDQKMHYATAQMLSRFRGHYVLLSTQKCGSHVVEKCLKEIPQSREPIVAELLSESHFQHLLQDPYANYVIQSALNLTKGKAHSALYQRVCSHNQSLRASPFSKKILSQTMRKK